MMVTEREKRATLAPLYRVAKAMLPQLAISQQNMEYYASLVHYYTIYDLRRIRSGQSNLYLLCYAWRRHRRITDNLIEAFGHHMRQIEQKTKEASEEAYSLAQTKQRQEAPSVGRVLLLYVDDATPFGAVRKQAFTIMPREALLTAGKRLSEKPTSQMELRWQEVNRTAPLFKKHLRPLAMVLEFSAELAGSPWLAALDWMKSVFSRQQRLAQRPVAEIPDNSCANASPRASFTLTTASCTAASAMSWCHWNARTMCSRVSTSRGCASLSKPVSMLCLPSWISYGGILMVSYAKASSRTSIMTLSARP
jgi:hypothetical protein